MKKRLRDWFQLSSLLTTEEVSSVLRIMAFAVGVLSVPGLVGYLFNPGAAWAHRAARNRTFRRLS